MSGLGVSKLDSRLVGRRFEFHPLLDGVSKPCQDQFLHPILVHSIIEKKENIGGQMGHTKKI
jgi:hypothetical protein